MDIQGTGSIGAGIVIAEGVRATATPAQAPEVRVVERHRPEGGIRVTSGSPPLEYAMERLGVAARITTECTLPIGAGYGLSAAALLSSISALSALFSLGLTREEIAALAHEAEIVHRTGLGDVAACRVGGIVCREGPGIYAPVRRIPGEGTIVALTLAHLPTPEVLSSPGAMRRVEQAYPGRCPRDLEDLFGLSRSFAEASGLCSPRVSEILAECRQHHVPASMTMLGEGVFALGESALPVLSRHGNPVRLHIAPRGFSMGEVIP